MSSSETDKKTESCSESDSIDDKLADLSCPFNWDMSVRYTLKDKKVLLAATSEQFQKAVDRQEYFPEQVFLYHLMMAYEHTIRDELTSAMEHINKAEQSLADIKQQATLENVEKVLQHLFIGTKCYLLQEQEQPTEMLELLGGIWGIDKMNETELAMLIGCQCSILIMFNTVEVSKKIICAKTAIKYDPTNGKWHYLLGEIHRHSRRATDYFQKPGDQETSAFEEAYRLSPNVFVGVTLAQLYRESTNFEMADKIYKEVHSFQPTSCVVRFQLALGFIRAQEYILAKECLDYIAERMPDSIRYLHYMGIYEEKCNKDLKAALPYYQRTTELRNASAEWQYIKCRKKLEPDWDPLPYMFDAFERYKVGSSRLPEELIIQIGLYYLFEIPDVLSACQYLTKAIEIDPNHRLLKNNSRLFYNSERFNVYHVLAREVQFALQNGLAIHNDHEIAVLKNTLELCRKNCKDLPPPSASPRARPPSSRFSSSNRTYDRGSSSRDQINWREERPGTSTRGFSKDYPPSRSNDWLNSPKRDFGSSNERDYTSWRSDKRETHNSRDEYHSSKTFNSKRDSASTDHMRGKDVQRTSSSEPRNNDAGNGKEAVCHLVKTVKGLNL